MLKNTIKSHKIQGIKLKQLPHFLSWNKANIIHSCESQFYTKKEKRREEWRWSEEGRKKKIKIKIKIKNKKKERSGH